MIFLIFVALSLPVLLLLYRYLRRRDSDAAVWRSAFKIGVAVGIVRSLLVCAGWWAVERTSGFLQVPGLFFAMLAWPEALVLPRSPKVLSLGGYITLGGLTFLGPIAWLLLLAGIVVASRRV